MARKTTADSELARFAALLGEHLTNGTRPNTATGEPWTYAAFAAEVQSSRETNDFASPRSASNWCRGKALPAEIEPILRALFGPSNRHADAREELRGAYLAARVEKNIAVIARTRPDPAGARWVVRSEQLAMDRTVRATDKRAALDPLRQQLQTAIAKLAAELVDPAKRLSNSRTWGGLSATAADFHAVVDGDPREMPKRLGTAYPLLLRLGRFLETDIRVQRDAAASDGPLDPDIHGLLTDLVRTAAPWLRGFPTVTTWDDAAGKALVRADLFQPAREFTRIAREQHTIPEGDAAEMELLVAAADVIDYQGQKAGNRAVGSAKNLMIAAAGTVAAFLSGAVASDFAPRSLLVQRAGATLAAAEAQVEAFAATVPADLRQALRGLVQEGQRLVESTARAGARRGRSPRVDRRTTSARLSALSPLGPLQDLLGTWIGQGFNVLWRPLSAPGTDHFLELNLTKETLQFTRIRGLIPNRALLGPDIAMVGVSYHQQIADSNHEAGIHLETGFWLTMPQTDDSADVRTVVRMASSPNGTTVLAPGIATQILGAPSFKVSSIIPFVIGDPEQHVMFPETDLSTLSAFRAVNLTGITQAMVDNPNSVLMSILSGQTIKNAVVLQVSSDLTASVLDGGTAKTAFLQGSPLVTTAVDATYSIEAVQDDAGGPDVRQLQYTQTELLNFNGLSWPHVNVATLRKMPPTA
jgi:hypothetical protein